MFSMAVYTVKEFNARSIGNYIRDLDAYKAGRRKEKPVAGSYMFMQGDRPRQAGYVAKAGCIAVFAETRKEAIKGLIQEVKNERD